MKKVCLSQNNFDSLLNLAIQNCESNQIGLNSKLSKLSKLTTQQSPTISLRTVNYNLFGRWLGLAGYEGQKERLAAIPQAIYEHPKMGPTVDVITLEESWCPTNTVGSLVCQDANDREILLQEFAKYGWKYSTPVVEGVALSIHGSAVNGGSLIVSRWPILAQYQAVYENSSAGDDAVAAKGVMYIRIIKEDAESGIKQAFNIFGTHLQAWSNQQGAAARAKQLQQLKDFENQLGLPTDGTEPVIYQGDMNTDQINYPQEVENMLNILQAKFPEKIGEQKYSSDPSTNFLVGKDGAADDNKCLFNYQQNLNGGRPNLNTRTKCNFSGINPPDCLAYCSCCPHEMLDYILYNGESKYLQPISSTVEIIPLKSINELTYDWSWCVGAKCLVNKKPAFNLSGNDLSDHYPVVANFVFQPIVSNFPLLNGCKFDSDCTYDAWNANCKCTGENCSYKNKYYKSNTGWFSKDIRADDGTNLGTMNSPLNEKCHYQASLAKCFCRPGNRF